MQIARGLVAGVVTGEVLVHPEGMIRRSHAQSMSVQLTRRASNREPPSRSDPGRRLRPERDRPRIRALPTCASGRVSSAPAATASSPASAAVSDPRSSGGLTPGLEKRCLRHEHVNPGEELSQRRCRSRVTGVSQGRTRGRLDADRPGWDVVHRRRESDDDIADGQWSRRVVLGDLRPWPRIVPARRRRRMEQSPGRGARLRPAAARPAREPEPAAGCMPARVAAPADRGRGRRACATRSPRPASGSRCAAAAPAGSRVRDRGPAAYDLSAAADRRSPCPR